ncbi:MAG: sugar phosphate isomerase/epimerase [Candidatus Accumulibacter sp.]|jgi:sugar phosphate isomerase/epimerase|nr:sugar phosphate isomerase/epimerase [Accumulibacter sp.]
MPDREHDKTRWNRDTWPIAAAMINFPGVLPDGSQVQEQSPEQWAEALREVVDAGFTELDPTDSWLRVADLSLERRREFVDLAKTLGLNIPAISTSRKSPIDPAHGDENLAYCHRVIDTAAEIGAGAVCFGLFGALTEAQKRRLWFWTADGIRNPDDPATYKKAVARLRELGKHAEECGLEVSLEMYEDTYIGTADGAVRFVNDVDVPAVGLNADIGNLVRLHRPVEHWRTMIEKVAPYAKYWHVKNYMRIEDPARDLIVSYPTSLALGIIDYRWAIRKVLEHGYRSAFLCEHYGGDGLSVCAMNRDYLRSILPRQL